MADIQTPIDTTTPKEDQETYGSQSSSKITYKAPIICGLLILLVLLLLIILFILYEIFIFAKKTRNNVFIIILIIPLIILIICIFISINYNIYFSIKIDGQNGKIYIKSIKYFFYF